VAVNEVVLAAMGPQLEVLLPELDERARRLVLGAVARAAGRGGTGAVARLAGASWQTVANGVAELESGAGAPEGRVRRPGGGRKPLAETDPGLVPALLALVEDSTRGDPGSPLLWTTRSVERLAAELRALGHRCGKSTVHRMLAGQGFSMQSNARVKAGRQHGDRDAQFGYIAAAAKEHMAAGQPVISVDAKKKELVGEFAQAGREWAAKGRPVEVRDHSFEGPGGHAIPYGIYDVAANTGFINVGTGSNTAALAVASVRRWWEMTGRDAYPQAGRLLVTCDAGGSNGWANRAWKTGMARFAQDAGLEITVCHFPPGTSKWNKIEHRLFSQVSHAWRGRPLTSYQVIIETISAITTRTGLTVTAALDTTPCPAGQLVSDAEIAGIEERCLTRHSFRGGWNYTFLPVPRPPQPPQPEPEPPGWPRAALNHPALTGLDPASTDTLAAAIEIPLAARREHDLYSTRGHPRKSSGGKPARITPRDRLLATLIISYLGIQKKELAPAFGIGASAMSQITRQTRDILATMPLPPRAPPPENPPETYDQLTAYAASHSITTTRPGPADTTPARHARTPATPPTHLNLG
jgi:Rhodopirellula transposase DDE domain